MRLCLNLALGLAFVSGAALLTSCESTDGGSAPQSSMYYGTGFNDPWYYGDYDDDVIVVRPPPNGDWGARPTHPIADPPSSPGVSPRPMPSMSMPSMPRPSSRR